MIPRPDLPCGVLAGPVRRVVAHGPPGRDAEEDTMRKILTAAALALAALAPATAANAAAPQDDYVDRFHNAATGRALDDSEEFGLRTFERNDGPWQRW